LTVNDAEAAQNDNDRLFEREKPTKEGHGGAGLDVQGELVAPSV
jgi:hypothetical protein